MKLCLEIQLILASVSGKKKEKKTERDKKRYFRSNLGKLKINRFGRYLRITRV